MRIADAISMRKVDIHALLELDIYLILLSIGKLIINFFN